MKKTLMIIASITIALASTAHAAAYKYTVNGQTKTACMWTTVGAAAYKAGLEGEATIKVTRLADDDPASIQCKADRAAKIAAKAQAAQVSND